MSGDTSFCYSGAEGFVIENGIHKGDEAPYISESNSYGELLLERLRADPKFPGQVNALTGQEETFQEMMEKSVKCAMWLKEQNALPGDVVGIATDIRMDAYVPAIASLYVGAVYNAWWDVGLTRDIAKHFLTLTQPKVLFAIESTAKMAAELVRETGLKTKVVALGKLKGFLSLEEILETQSGASVDDFRCTKLASIDAPAILLYTSGTTGLPKAALHSHRSLYGNLNLAAKLGEMDKSSIITTLLFSPLAWVTGMVCMLRGIAARERRVIHPEFKEETTFKLIEKFKVNWTLVGTSGAVRLLKCPSIGKYDLSSLQFIYVGGAVLKKEIQKNLVDAFPQATIFQAYGATELGGVGLQQSANYKPGSCGRIVKNLSMKVVDAESGAILGPNQTGEACFKSPFMMTGYYRNPEESRKAIDSDGWYHTGDLVHYDEEGHVFVTDRIKELIKYRGQHISPAMIEAVLQNHPGVSEAAVVGVPDDLDDDHAIAFVAKTPTSTVTKEELLKLVEDSLPDYMKLRGGLMFLDQLPHTTSGKVARSSLKNLAKSLA